MKACFLTVLFFLSLVLATISYAAFDVTVAGTGTIVALTEPSPSPSATPMVQVAEPAAPPAWAQDLMMTAQKLPVVGPIVSKTLLILGIVSSILTMLSAFLMSVIALLSGAFSYAGLAATAARIQAFQSSKFMYWIKFFSLFNAKKAEEQKAA
jgi:hypothetical protein